MDIAKELINPCTWQRFYAYKHDGGHLSRQEDEELLSFIQNREYLPVVRTVLAGGSFPPPKKSAISKMSSQKKRIVYTFPRPENYVLKFLTFLLQEKYDHLFSPNLYSFRRGTGVRNAIRTMTGHPGIRKMWCYKVDIQNYFNSIPVDRLLPTLELCLANDPVIYQFLTGLLLDSRAEEQGKRIEESKGIMAGTPISPFLANLYLADMDWNFHKDHVLYARYSDDIIVFADSEQKLEQYIQRIHETLDQSGLAINTAKEERSLPGQHWVFLGIVYADGTIDVAPASVNKLKAKMRRKTRALMRWKARKNTTGTNAAKAFVRSFRRKLFDNDCEHELTWTRWYFPLITTDASLRVLDQYAQQCIRYLVTGKHTKAAFNCRYGDIKELGYVSLVNCYHNHARFPEKM